MGQIVIDIPNKTNRRYNIERADDGRALLKALDQLLSRNDLAKITKQQIQDLHDGVRAERILGQMKNSGESYSVAELRKEFGLS